VFVPAVLVIAGLAGLAILLAIKAQRGAVGTGAEGLLREIGTATEDLDPSGKVFVHGELWSAATAGPAIARGSRVRIVAVDRMELRVAPADGAADGEAVAAPGIP
jgi:membrane-bound serine protease (ClpP class)